MMDYHPQKWNICLNQCPELVDHYIRTFEIEKKTGGKRKISSPRFFLKTVLYWINTYFLIYLKVHSSCHAYEKGKSIITNAANHLDQMYVANIDIEDFFGQINTKKVRDLLLRNGFGVNLAYAISKLTTLKNALPQGSPTSPKLSNALLYEMDEKISEIAIEHGMFYSRYADDITLSGNSRTKIVKLIKLCEKELSKYELSLKKEKTRIASKGGSQRVTGVVVNQKMQPPIEYRKRVRAMFHQASLKPESYSTRINELRGHYSYLNSFIEIRGKKSMEIYRNILNRLEKVASGST